jgi:hypothetical protein
MDEVRSTESAPRSWQRPEVALAMLLATVALFVITGVLELAAQPDDLADFLWGVWWGISLALPFPLVGYVLARRVSANPLGWLFLLAPLLLIGSAALTGLVNRLGSEAPAVFIYLIQTFFFVGAGLLAGFVLLLFPTGRPPTPRWRWVGVVAAIGLLLFATGSLTQDCIVWQIGDGIDGETVPSACGEPAGPSYVEFEGWFDLGSVGGSPVAEAIAGLGFVLVSVSFLAGIVSLVVRFRRAEGVERDQLRWPSVVVLVLGSLVLGGIGVEVAGGDGSLLGEVAQQVAAIGIPISIGLAVTRYRLYDVDRVISRTVAYSIVGLLVAGLYGVVALGPALVLGDGRDSPAWLVALGTLIAFVAFAPIRNRVQQAVDRRFDRARYDAEAIATRFSERVRNETDLESVADGLGDVAGTIFRPESLGVWVRSEA